MSTRNYTVACLSEAMAPITHAARTTGNESLIAREPVVTARGVQWLPFLSGNALRHRAIREPGWRWLIDEYDLRGKLNLAQLNFCFHGGNLTEGGGREDTARIARFHEIFPLGRLLGGSLPDQILAGYLQSWRGALVCEENRAYLEHVLPSGVLPTVLRPAEAYVSGYQYTRSDAAKSQADLVKSDEPVGADSNLMIFSGQAVLRGAMFVHGFTVSHCTALELGALLWSLRLWQQNEATIGGQAARGHGRLRMSLVTPTDGDGWDTDPVAAVDMYLAYARSQRDAAAAWLHAAFHGREEKKVAKAKGKAAKATEVATVEPMLLGTDDTEAAT